MDRRRLGTTGPDVSEIGLGLMGMSSVYGRSDDNESLRTLHRAVELDVTHFDTADVYGMGHNEKLLGRFLAEIDPATRASLVVATKFGNRYRPTGTGGGMEHYVDTSAAWVQEACDASLDRLGVDHIDLYYAHRRNPDVPIEDTIDAMADLVSEGKVHWLGLS